MLSATSGREESSSSFLWSPPKRRAAPCGNTGVGVAISGRAFVKSHSRGTLWAWLWKAPPYHSQRSQPHPSGGAEVTKVSEALGAKTSEG
jgi:hypothetical protein